MVSAPYYLLSNDSTQKIKIKNNNNVWASESKSGKMFTDKHE